MKDVWLLWGFLALPIALGVAVCLWDSIGEHLALITWRPPAGLFAEDRDVDGEARDPAELRGTAYHEAAHFAVLYSLQPDAVREVTIIRSAHRLGAMFHTPFTPAQVDVAGVVFFAGCWGEVLSGVAQATAMRGAAGDFANAVPVIEQFVASRRRPGPVSMVPSSAPPMEQAQGHYQAQAFLHVSNLWGSIEAIATALLRHRRLDREAAVEAFNIGKTMPSADVRSRLVAGWRRSQAADERIARSRG